VRLEPQTRISKEINFLLQQPKRKLQANAWTQVFAAFKLNIFRWWSINRDLVGTPEKELPNRDLARRAHEASGTWDNEIGQRPVDLCTRILSKSSEFIWLYSQRHTISAKLGHWHFCKWNSFKVLSLTRIDSSFYSGLVTRQW
jgi:hypothetical protein